MDRAEQRPLVAHRRLSTPEKLPEAPGMFDLAEHWVDDRLAPSVLEHHPLRVAVAELADLGDDELELDSEPLEDLAPAGRG